MRHELKKRRIAKCPVCFSLEKPQAPHYSKEHLETLAAMQESGSKRRAIPGSVSFVPSVAGLMMAGYIVRKLTHSVAYGGV
jgi:tRNA A37 threonylcarbamoyladenosine dehydratase